MTSESLVAPRRLREALQWTALAFLATVNFLFVGEILFNLDFQYDWQVLTDVGRQMLSGENPYEAAGRGTIYRYSPLFAPIYGLTAPLGVWFWRALAFASLVLLPRKVALIALLSFPFWFDVQHGNILTIMGVLAFLSVERQAWAQVGFLALAMLVPRPLMVPVTLWILWDRRAWWPWIVSGLVAYAAAVWATGWGAAWLSTLVSIGGAHMQDYIGWVRFFGPWWPLAALPLTAYFMWRRRFGFASLALSPYWIMYYAIFLLIELATRPPSWMPHAEGFVAGRKLTTVYEDRSTYLLKARSPRRQ
ncbi:MAG: hypothetical protein ACT4OQ_12580 [Chloroflexota bacterium]